MYNDLEAILHDVFWDAEPDANELPLIEHFLTKHPGRALEVGCGSGRLLLPLIQKGFHIEGVEISADMVQLAHQKARTTGIEAVIHTCDIRDFNPQETYDSILIPAFTLQLLPRKEAVELLYQLRNIASPTARIYLSTFIPWAEITDELEPDVWHLDKQAPHEDKLAQCHTRHSIHRASQELHRSHSYKLLDSSGNTLQQHSSEQTLQWYHLPELAQMLETSGWKMTSWTADFIVNNPDSDASVLTIY